VPRTVARAFHLAAEPRGLWVVLAPAYAMALVHAKPRRLAVSWLLVALIVLAVALVRRLPSPWRSIVDAGVVVGLAWGLVSLFLSFARALKGEVPAYPLDLPGS
jgi:predicted membrane protein